MFQEYFDTFNAILDGREGWLRETITIIFLVLFFNVFVKWLLYRLHLHLEKHKKIWADSFVAALYLPLTTYIWFFALTHTVILILQKLSFDLEMEWLHQAISVGFVLNMAWFLMRWKKKIVNYSILKSKRHEMTLDPGKIDVINKLFTMLILFITMMSILEVTDRNMSTLIAFGGVGGLAIAIASQEVIGNFFGGLMIYLTHPFAIGDWINLPEKSIEGIVEEIGWYMTRIRTFEKRPIYVPNSTFCKGVVVTPSRMSHRRFRETIGLRYSDVGVLKEVIKDIKIMLKHHPEIDQELDIQVCLHAFGTYSLDILVSAYTKTVNSIDFGNVKEHLFFEILDILKKHGAELASQTTILELSDNSSPQQLITKIAMEPK